MSLSEDQVAQYTSIIDQIIANGDLSTISAKQIRTGLQASIEEDLAGYKNAVKELIFERFDQASNQVPASPEAIPIRTNGHVKKQQTTPKRAASPAEEGTDEEATPPQKKKRKAVDADAALAAKLQAQENTRSRATRGGGAKFTKRAAAPKKKKEKSSKKVGEDDDSDVIGSDGEKKEVIRKGGFHKEYVLSAPLAELVGEHQLSRPQVVKKIWEHIKLFDLQVPEDKRLIRCDEKMAAVFKHDRVHMFTMNKLLGDHLYPADEQ